MQSSIFYIKTNAKIHEKKRECAQTLLEYDELKELLKYVNIQWFECINFDIKNTPLVKDVNLHCLMLVDEEGKLNNKPFNPTATALYNSPNDYIVGDIMLCKVEGENMYAFDEKEAEYIRQYFYWL